MHFKAVPAQNNVGSLPLDHRHTVFSLFLKYVFGVAEVSVAEFQPQEMLSLANYFFLPAIVRFGPLRVRALFLVF